jgi:hypothetical protein
VTGLGVVDAEAVEEDEGLFEGRSAEREVGLHAVGGAGLQVERGVLTEEIDDGVGGERLLARFDEVDGAVAFGEGEGFEGGGDGDALGEGGGSSLRRSRVGGRRLLGGGGAEAEDAEEEGRLEFHGCVSEPSSVGTGEDGG